MDMSIVQDDNEQVLAG